MNGYFKSMQKHADHKRMVVREDGNLESNCLLCKSQWSTSRIGKRLHITMATIILIILTTAGCATKFTYDNIDFQDTCSAKGGYWFNNKCWREFEDARIPPEEIENHVKFELDFLTKYPYTIDGQECTEVLVYPEDSRNMLIVYFQFTRNGVPNQELVIPVTINKLKVGAIIENLPVYYSPFDSRLPENEDATSYIGLAQARVLEYDPDLDDIILEFTGNVPVADGAPDTVFKFYLNEIAMGAGTSKFDIDGDLAYLSGYLGTRTYEQLRNLKKTYPEVKTIVLTEVHGSLNDAVNVHTGRLLRKLGLNTKVLSDSVIESGGVDLFTAGVERIVEQGAKIGVHSWCCYGDGRVPIAEVPRDHPAHADQLDYFTQILGSEIGPEFYFFTLNSAPAEDIYYMTDEEIRKWQIATQFNQGG